MFIWPRFTHSRITGAVVLCAALFGCIRQDALYPTLMPFPVVYAETIGRTPVAEVVPKKIWQEALQDPVQADPANADESRDPPSIQPDPPSPIVAVAAPSPALTHAFHSYFIDREVRSDNIKMFPRWTGMLSRYNAEAHTLDALCGEEPYSACKLKEWKSFLEDIRDAPLSEKLEAVNRFVNKYPYVDDIVNWGFDNYWETPYEFQRKSGNCKDYAIAKFISLRAIGVSNDIMRIVVLRDLNLGGVIHAVLVVSVDEKAYILDNQIKQVIAAVKVYHYVPIYSINEQHWWQHFMLE